MAEVRRLAALAALALLAACGSGSPGPQPAELTALENPRPLRVLWSSSLSDREPYSADWPPPPPPEFGDRWIFFPILVGDAVYAVSREGYLARLDAATGRVRWRAAAEMQVSSGVGADADTVAVANEDGEVAAFDAGSGKVRWRARVSSEVLAPPEVGAGLVLVRSIDNRIFAFDASDGAKARDYSKRGQASLGDRSPHDVARPKGGGGPKVGKGGGQRVGGGGGGGRNVGGGGRKGGGGGGRGGGRRR